MGRSKSIYAAQTAANSSFFAKPWFVAIVVFGCFGILTPKIFLPLFRQIFGLNKPGDEPGSVGGDRTSPYLRARTMRQPDQPAAPPPEPVEYSRPGPQFGRHAPVYTPPSGSSSKSLLNYLLPVYAIGIGLYMVYTLCKVFNKDKKDEKEENEDSEFEPSSNKSPTSRFRERNEAAFRWDANDGEFKFASKYNSHFAKSEESEDEMNNYERYKNLDPDYVEYLKERRRMKRLEEKGLSSPKAKFPEMNPAEDDIALTPNIGLTSITNTNVLMNDTLERMKFSLNKINNQLIEVEKKGSPLDDPEIDSLRMQLTQTELQMAKIMNIINSVSDTIQNERAKMKTDASDDYAGAGGVNRSAHLEELDEDDEGQPIYHEDSDDREQELYEQHYQLQQQQQLYQAQAQAMAQAMARKQQQQQQQAMLNEQAGSRKKNNKKQANRAKQAARNRTNKRVEEDYIEEEEITIEKSVTVESGGSLRQRRGNKSSPNEASAGQAAASLEKAKNSDEEKPRTLNKKSKLDKHKQSVSSISSMSLPSESCSSESSESRSSSSSSSSDRKASHPNRRGKRPNNARRAAQQRDES